MVNYPAHSSYSWFIVVPSRWEGVRNKDWFHCIHRSPPHLPIVGGQLLLPLSRLQSLSSREGMSNGSGNRASVLLDPVGAGVGKLVSIRWRKENLVDRDLRSGGSIWSHIPLPFPALPTSFQGKAHLISPLKATSFGQVCKKSNLKWATRVPGNSYFIGELLSIKLPEPVNNSFYEDYPFLNRMVFYRWYPDKLVFKELSSLISWPSRKNFVVFYALDFQLLLHMLQLSWLNLPTPISESSFWL